MHFPKIKFKNEQTDDGDQMIRLKRSSQEKMIWQT